MTTALECRELHTYYGDSYILQGVSLDVNQGEIVSLLGRNGAGKTTTIHTIFGFVTPREGTVLYRGEEITHEPPHRIAQRGIGLVPQGRRLFPNLTVRENITLGSKQSTNGAEDWTLQRVYDLFPNLEKRAGNRASQLSGGEQQMVAIARALMTNPDLLLLDEPSEGLAPQLVEQVRRVLEELKQHDLSILLVEQNLPLARRLSDRIYVMTKGRIRFQGPPQTFDQGEDLLAVDWSGEEDPGS